MVQAGNNVLQQKNQVLHKVVDEKWLSIIEESIDAINNIIEKPRRFVTTSEEVVPVALAKKITADSVRHLSMNTQFIASNEDGEVQPTRVLNVTTEESYDLYENRFIYHLIQRLVTFIDKRTDIIFWSTGDEIKNTLSYQSKVDDAYEEIEYKIEMSIKNRQNFAENDSDNMQVFMRIDRVRRLVMAFRTSAFCSLMSGCAKVRSPIQRTNLMMKDPNYRTCYKLWQFLESYDDIGYTIEVKDTALEFDEEYLFQLYTNLITNYTVFKSLLEDVPRRLEEEENRKKRKVIKPKFIKKIEEQIVDDYNIPDVEVKQVIIEEVTQAQLDAEAKLAEETENRKNAEEAVEELEAQMMATQQQLMSMMEMNTAAEEEAQLAQQEKEEAVQYAEELQREKEELEKQLEEARKEIEEVKKAAKVEVEEMETKAKEKVEQTQKNAKVQVEQAKERIKQVENQVKEEIIAKILAQQNEKEAVLASEEAKKEIQKAKQKAQKEVEQARKKVEETKKAVEEAKEEARVAKAQAEEQYQRAEKEAQARVKAQEKTEANSLSKYIITALNSRKQKKEETED
jgi:hypothetical protein